MMVCAYGEESVDCLLVDKCLIPCSVIRSQFLQDRVHLIESLLEAF